MFEFSHRLRLVSLVLGASVSMTFASTGCVVHRYHSEGSSVHTVNVPPRYATHGYVHHYRDVVLVFDRSWNGYWVQKHPNHYFYADHYYRWHGGRWQKARRFGGPWVSLELRFLPAGLHHRETAQERRGDHRETARERRGERRDAATERRAKKRTVAKERRDERREPARERPEVAKESREDYRETTRERREVKKKREIRREVATEHREVAREHREERRDVAKEQREERREVAKEQREVAKEQREERREVAKEQHEVATEQRDEHRKADRERREEHREAAKERREIAESQKTRRTVELPRDLARGSARHRRPTLPKAADEELLANRGVE
jgi:hypothetical protein